MNLQSLCRRWGRWLLAGACIAHAPAAFAAFTLTTVHDGGNPARPQYVIDTDAGLVFKVRAYDNGGSTTSAGDISSLVYQGVEYADPSRGSQLNSGADWLYTGVTAVEVRAEAVDASGRVTPASTANNGVVTGSDYFKITQTVRSTLGGVLTHYYLVKRGQPHIYMATHFTEQPTVHAQMRFIVRVPIARLPNGGPAGVPGGLAPDGQWSGDIRGTSGAIEASDVFGFGSGHPRAGQTRSKHYANMRLKDWNYFGGTGPGVGLWFYRGNNEGNSGGPFYRCLLQQITSTHNELTYMVNYGEAQTEAFRLGVLNDYTLMFTNGAPPSARPDTSWFRVMNLVGYVPPEARGGISIAGLAGRQPGYAYTYGLANAQAQYWVDAHPVDGHALLDGMLPGDYTMSVYKGELAVQTLPVRVTANTRFALNTVSINADPSTRPALWRIGDWDGTPQEFLNGAQLTWMHPSDVRMAAWTVPPFVVGSAAASAWPAYQWKDVNDGLQIRFLLRRGQNLQPLRLRVGVSADFNSARPRVTVNSWVSAIPPAPPKATRNLTVGTYRGFNRMYEFDIPASQLVVGTNTITLNAVSGTAGARFLSPGLAFDAIDLVPLP